ncbi:hypothetical protein FISHEDRAFT_69172 [Fistulina hepatica ATCC 64428]|uniref:Uncharacterized protein n=1 Tax=Fistulina hepatica ATCC 64428 TaxID=1128425 RepID=A0A0D7AN57_9AGAR|nr:hypothetical protein FISHEDRAFT_69172 [Fistulina hepatica ATCC 64428]
MRSSTGIEEKMATLSFDSQLHEDESCDAVEPIHLLHSKSGVIFAIPHYIMLQSGVYRDMISHAHRLPGEGTRRCPISIENGTVDDFRRLRQLKDLSSTNLPTSPFDEEKQADRFTINDWLSVFETSLYWQMERVEKLARTKLYNAPAERPALVARIARSHNLKEWYHLAIIQLVKRKAALGLEDAQHLDINLLLQIAKMREQIAWNPQISAWQFIDQPRDFVYNLDGLMKKVQESFTL